MPLLSTCIVQEGQITAPQRLTLERQLKAIASARTGQRLAVAWIVVPPGSGYSAGKPSTSSIVQLGVPDGFSQPDREALMRDVGDQWCAITGQTPYELLVSAPDETPARKLLRGLLANVPLRRRPRIIVGHVAQLIRSFARG